MLGSVVTVAGEVTRVEEVVRHVTRLQVVSPTNRDHKRVKKDEEGKPGLRSPPGPYGLGEQRRITTVGP